MKPSSWDKQLGLASPRESAASQSDQTNNPSKDEVRNEVGLDVSHYARISQRGGEKLFSLTSPFIGLSVIDRVLKMNHVVETVRVPWGASRAARPRTHPLGVRSLCQGVQIFPRNSYFQLLFDLPEGNL
jgi:hypothetical protein